MHDDYKDESKYINSLSDENKEWLNTFLQGYYHRSKPAMDKLKFPVMLRRSRYNQHRGVVGDIYNKRNRIYPEAWSSENDAWESITPPDEETGEGLVRTKVLKKKVYAI